MPWARVKETAAAVRARLEALELESYLKTTGGKGLHVVVPLAAGKQDWAQVKAFSHAVALEFVEAAPELFIATASKAGRRGKIFLDYLRNDRMATAVAPLSPRARDGATVAIGYAHSAHAAEALVEAIKHLPEREQYVMSMYYEHDMNLKEIAAVLKVTESRVCQLHSQSIARLRTRLREW